MPTYYLDPVLGNDSNAGTSAGSGNAWASFTKAAATVAAGDKVFAKASGNYNESPSFTTTAGTAATPIIWEGYTTTPGDGGLATIDGQNTRAQCCSLNKSWQQFRNLALTGATTRAVDYTAGVAGVRWLNCQFLKGAGTATAGIDSSTFSVLAGGFVRCAWNGFATYSMVRASGVRLTDCQIINCGQLLGSSFGSQLFVDRTLFRGGTGPAITIQSSFSSASVRDSIIYGKTSGGGILIQSGGTLAEIYITNNIIVSNAGGYGLEAPDSAAIYADRNAYFGNSSGPRGTISAGANDITLTGDPFVDAANGDFNLNNVAGAGAALRAVTFNLPG